MKQVKRSAIRYDAGHWHITKPLRMLLRTSMAKENTRYSISGIYVAENALVVTDGRRLLKVSITNIPPKMKSMIYKCVDGWLLGPMDGNFPKYQEIIPSIEESTLVAEFDALGHEYRKTGEQEILAKLANAEYYCDAIMLLEILAHLVKSHGTQYKFYVAKSDPSNRALLLTCNCWFGTVAYVQMPVYLTKKG